jgi:hypothetical protein
MACAPDAVIAEMAGLLGEAVRDIDQALAHLGPDKDAATEAADAAIHAERRHDRAYYTGMGALLGLETVANGSPAESSTAAAPESARW